MARVLVTGAHGFIGRNISIYLANAGWSVLGIGHGEWVDETPSTWGLSAWKTDDIDVSSLVSLCTSPPDVIIHAAGGSTVGKAADSPHDDFIKTVISTQRIIEYARLHAPNCRIVYLSSAAVYGQAAITPTPESQPLQPVSIYGTHKLVAEELLLGYGRALGIKVRILRLFSVYGPGLKKQLLWDACCKFSNHSCEFNGTGDEIRDWCHIRDVCEWIRILASSETKLPVVLNGGSGTGTSVRSILSLASEQFALLGKLRFNGVRRIGDPIAYIADTTLGGDIGFRVLVSLRDGIREYASWFKNEYKRSSSR